MTATIETDLRTVKGPRLGVVHLLRLRKKPIEHNDFLRRAYGDVLKLNVFGTTLYAAYGLDAIGNLLEIDFSGDFRHGAQIVEQRVLPRALTCLAIDHAGDVIDRTRLSHRHGDQPALVVTLVRYGQQNDLTAPDREAPFGGVPILGVEIL